MMTNIQGTSLFKSYDIDLKFKGCYVRKDD